MGATPERQQSSHRGPGRPKDLEKRRAILEATYALFCEKGIGAVTMEGAAARAGVSKATVYSHFADKAALIGALVRDKTEALGESIEEASHEVAGPLESRLNRFGQALTTLLAKPEVIMLERVVEAEAATHPELARAYFEAGPHTCRRLLASILARLGPQAGLEIADPVQAAEQLLAMWTGTCSSREARMGLLPQPGPEAVAAHVAECTSLFLRAATRR